MRIGPESGPMHTLGQGQYGVLASTNVDMEEGSMLRFNWPTSGNLADRTPFSIWKNFL